MNKGLILAQDYSLENRDASYFCILLDSFHSGPYFFLCIYSHPLLLIYSI